MTMMPRATAVLPNGGHVNARFPLGAVVRSYLALTKPRIIELLLTTTLPTMMLAARGLPPVALIGATLLGGAFAAGAANTINCCLDRHRHADAAHLASAARRRAGEQAGPPGAGVGFRGASRSVWHRPARTRGELARGAPRRRGDPVLRLRLHTRAQAPRLIQHRRGRRRGMLPDPRRLGGGNRQDRAAGRPTGERGVLLDPTSLLVPRDEVPRGLRRSAGADAARGRPACRGRTADSCLLVRDGRCVAHTDAFRGLGLRRLRVSPWRMVPDRGPCAVHPDPARLAGTADAAVPRLDQLSGVALRGGRIEHPPVTRQPSRRPRPEPRVGEGDREKVNG